ncbi:UNVERIFIED_CONTAM: 13E12 repeat family protein [Microbacterium sp. SLM126]
MALNPDPVDEEDFLDRDVDDFVPPVPDAVDLVIEVATMMSVFAADRFERVHGMRREALDDAARHGVALTDVVERGIRLELAAALRMTEHAAGALIARAEALVRRFPDMLDSLGGGRTTERHAEIFVDAMVGVEPELCDTLVPRAVALAEVEAAGTFRRSLARLIETVRAQTLDERHAAAVTRRRVHVERGDDGMAWLMAYLPAVEAHAIHSRLTAMAKAIVADDGESRTLDQVRADVLGDLLIEGDTTALPVAARGMKASVVVTVPALALVKEERGRF